jgi:hypothetical protein
MMNIIIVGNEITRRLGSGKITALSGKISSGDAPIKT